MSFSLKIESTIVAKITSFVNAKLCSHLQKSFLQYSRGSRIQTTGSLHLTLLELEIKQISI
jgi:hypothetical protein